jgi:hypothetical protein
MSDELKWQQTLTDERVDTVATSQEVENVIFIVAGKLGLQGIGDKILILVDKFKSGYECKDCEETGVFIACACSRRGEFGVNNNGKRCSYMGKCSTQHVGQSCKTCAGTGTTLKIPDTAKAIPTSGVIVSVGPNCTVRRLGERVLFGAHTGYYLPFKGNAKIKVMREDEPLCLIYAVDNNNTLGDFLQIDENSIG